MIKSQELADPKSCLNKAGHTEPVFVLRANDELAADIVREWARRYQDTKMNKQGKLTPEQKIKKEEALKLARDMETWWKWETDRANAKAREEAELAKQLKKAKANV